MNRKSCKFILFSIIFFLISFTIQAAPTSMPLSGLASFESETNPSAYISADAAQVGGQMAMGDLNCDGSKDIIISSQTYSNFGVNPIHNIRGRIYIYFGGSTFSGNYNLSGADVIITGANDLDVIGRNIAVVDIDETDGCDDLVVLAGGGGGTPMDIYLVEGDSGLVSQNLTSSLYTNLIQSTSTEVYNYLHSLGPLDGDYNNDGTINGLDDYLAFCSSVTARCYLMPVVNMLSTTGTMEELSSFYVIGVSIEHSFASGDIDGDGFHDLIVGNSYSAQNKVGIFFGPVSSSPSLKPIWSWWDPNLEYLSVNGAIGATPQEQENYQGKDIKIKGTRTSAGFGGNVNSGNIIKISQDENYDDIVISSPFENSIYNGSTETGVYYVLSGESLKNFRDSISTTNGITLYADTSTITSDPNDTNNYIANFSSASIDVLYYTGGANDAHYGLAYNSAANSDVNNDGFLDFIAGGSGYTESTLAGRVNVICGGDMQTLFGSEEILNTTLNTSEVYMDGPANGATFGSIVVSGEDVTGDGIDDTLIAAGEYNNGTVYLVPGSNADDFDGDGFSVVQGDCNEALSSVYPGATEVANEFDDDCDNIVDNNLPSYDDDGDSFTEDSGDCDDANTNINPSATEICSDGLDNNCDGVFLDCNDVDNDSDGFTENQNDCDDTNANISPSATETCGDNIDQDCSGADLICPPVDSDNDTFAADVDCDDNNANIYPGAAEICGNGIDENCDGVDETCPIDPNDVDDDGDSFTENAGDCNDTNANISPAIAEICGNGIDENCDGVDETCPVDPNDVDDDGDSFTENAGDCDDSNANINPSATEICGDGIDQDCSGADSTCAPIDNDSDGYNATADCNDNNPTVYPGATEVCGDGIDQDCSGADLTCPNPDAIDDDGDGFSENQNDCDDTNDTVYPGAIEIGDMLDNDCDNKTDEGLVKLKVTNSSAKTNGNAIGSIEPGEDFNLSVVANNISGFTNFTAEIFILEDSYQNLQEQNSGSWMPWGKGQIRASLNPWFYSCGASNQNCTQIEATNIVLSNNGMDISFTLNTEIPTKIVSGNYGIFVKLYTTTTDGNFILLSTASPYQYSQMSQIWNNLGSPPAFYDDNNNGTIEAGEMSNLIAMVE